MARLIFKGGESNYSREDIDAITIVAQKVASIMDKLSERDARVLAIFIDPSLDRYVLGGWSKRGIIQEAIEDAIYNHANNPYWMENIYDFAEIIASGSY